MPCADIVPEAELLDQLRRLGAPDDIARAHPVDIAEALNILDARVAGQALASLPFDLAVRVLEQPELDRRAALFQGRPAAESVPLIRAMSPDQQAHLFREFPSADRARLLGLLDPPVRTTLEHLLGYTPETAGGIMTTDYVGVPSDWTADQTLTHIRQAGRIRQPVYAIYVLTADQRLARVVSLRELLGAEPGTLITNVGERRRLVAVKPSTDREEVARLLAKYNLLAVPVVDDEQRLVGTITVDDVIDALVKEQTEDVHKLGGLAALDQPYPSLTFSTVIRKRAGWLCALFFGEMLTATAMQHFQDELSRALVLSLFIPLIMSSGGNSGSQATSLIIRALALHEVRIGDWWRVAARELPAGLSLGAILGMVGVLRITVWQQLGLYDYGAYWTLVAATVGAALVGVVTFGSLVGSMLPFLLRRLGFDPASASAPFVATLVDVTGLIIYFGVAYLVLHGTLL
jgi:magnesium transporter